MKKIIALLLVLMLTLCLVSCSKKEDSSKKKLRIGISHITMYDEWCKGVYDEFLRQGKEFGYEIDIQSAEGDPELQAKQIENFVAMKYDMILVDPVSSDGIVTSLKVAGDNNIPVIAFDANTSYDKLITHVAWDHADTGVQSAKYVADYAKKNLGGKVRVGMITGLSSEHVKCRSDAFMETLEKELGKENVEYVFNQDNSSIGSVESAANIVTNNISKYCDFIWGAVDNYAMGARVALESNNIEGTKVISAGAWGTDPFTKLYTGDNWYYMCIGVSPEEIVRLTLQSVKDYFDGKDIPREQNIDLAIIDSTNIQHYVDLFMDPEEVKKLKKGPNVK